MSFCTVSQGLGGLGLAWKRDVGRHPWALGGLPAQGDIHGSGCPPPTPDRLRALYSHLPSPTSV